MPFPYDEDNYAAVNVGAQRKSAPLIGAPGVVQHFALWKPSTVKKSYWHISIDYLLYRLFFLLHRAFALSRELNSSLPDHLFNCPNLDRGNERLYLLRHNTPNNFTGGRIADTDNGTRRSPFIATNVKERSIRYEIFSLSTVFENIALTVRAELHNEYCALTFLGDLSLAPNASGEDPTYNTLHKAFASLQQLVSQRISHKQQGGEFVPSSSSAQDAEFRVLGDDLYNSFHNLLSTKLISPCEIGFPNDEDIRYSNVGGLFADFRGAVLRIAIHDSRSVRNVNTSMASNSASGASAPTPDLDDRYKFDLFPLSASPAGQRRTLHSRHLYSRFTGPLALRVIESLWPAIRQCFPVSDNEHIFYGKPEFTISRFLKGGALYISSLGRLTHNARSRAKDPVRYLVIATYPSRWQIGRLVERINNLGVFRLAALYAIADLQSASDGLRELYNDWRDANIASQKSAAQSVDARLFAFRLGVLGLNMESGLAYRIERSNYYVRTFEDLLKGARIRRVEGFQPYSHFVQRRMGGTFEFISRIGLRYAELRREIELELGRQRTDQMTKLLEFAAQQVEGIRSIESKIKERTDDLEKSHNKTNRLLKRAEIFLGLGTIYYVATIIFDAGQSYADNTYKIYAFIGVGAMVAGYLWWRHNRDE